MLHSIVVNCRLLSVQVGAAGGALTAALGAFKAYVELQHLTVTVPDWLFVVAGVLTAGGVFFARMIPQPNVPTQ